MSSRTSTLDLCKRHLYTDVDKMNSVPAATRDRILRIRSGYTLWNEYPRKKPKDIALHLMNQFNIEKSQAYDDIRLIQDLLGSINRASKDWHLFRFNQMIEKAYEVAETKNDSDSMTKAAAAYGKYNQLDKEDPTEFPWDDIKPQSFVITSDPSVIGIKPIANLKDKIAKLYDKYKEDINMVEDVTYEDVDLKNALEDGQD
jgi:hypothetical protein